MSVTVDVRLGTRSYDIHIGHGLIAQAGHLLSTHARGTIPVVTDEHVAKRHLPALQAAMAETGLTAHPIVLEPGESSKSFSGLEHLCSALLGSGVGRDGLIIALGGGVIGDLTGFAAGILKRGIGFVQIPTTLLAMVDSSVGGKTAINTAEGKNLVGLFHQPKLVIADVALLDTLPQRELRAGYAEIVKYGLLGDTEFFSWLETNGAAMLAGDVDLRERAIARSCRMKADIVARDETETGERALLNLGHTFGHALEAATGYSARLLHGEAVAIGMVLALRLSVRLGLAPPDALTRLENHLRQVGLPLSPGDIPGPKPGPDELLAHMAHDKKAFGGRLTFVLLRQIGEAFVSRDVPESAVRAILAA